uniref:Uncharacterized protein n=1 Tax=Salix viminalis TaxID=40686 RepID=A0A6N2MU01_SALVM
MAENSQPAGTPSMAGQPVLECCNSGINNLFHCRNHIIGNSWLEIDGLEIFVEEVTTLSEGSMYSFSHTRVSSQLSNP